MSFQPKKEQVKVVTNGASSLSLLGIAFVVLKLTGFINWSWWWVTAPFWAIPAIIIAFFVVAILFIIVTSLIPDKKPQLPPRWNRGF